MNNYEKLIQKVFFDSYENKLTKISFNRNDLAKAAEFLNISRPKNLGDILYSFRYRNNLPTSILETQPEGKEWIIEGEGRAKYAFKLVRINRITPSSNLLVINIPDSTPEIVSKYALSDEQALLARIRYNRLIDIFLGVTTYSLQNHLRTTVKGIGQIEIDELYVGLDDEGCHYVIPVQAKGGTDKLSVIQTKQDYDYCLTNLSALICKPISTQFMDDNLIAIFQLTVQDDEVKIVKEKHYRLTPSDEIKDTDLTLYRENSNTK